MTKYFNTAFSLSMVPFPFHADGEQLTAEKAAEFLAGNVANVANPSHANTLDAVTKKLGVDVRNAKGGRVKLMKGDQILVAQVTFPPSVPRETKEYTDEQVAQGVFEFDLVTIG